MVDVKCPITGTILHVSEERVAKYEKSGYKRVEEEAPKRVSRKSKDEAIK